MKSPSKLNGSYQIVTGDKSGEYAAPAISTTVDDATNYVSVPKPTISGNSAEIKFTETYNYFGLFWGSVDEYNELSFYNGLNLVEAFTGLSITNPADGNQTAPSNNAHQIADRMIKLFPGNK